MAPTRQNPNLKFQVTICSIAAIFVLNCVAAGNTIAQTRIAPPLEIFPAIFAVLGWLAFTIPLLWWRSNAGFVGAIGAALLALTWPLLVLSGAAGELAATVPLSPMGILTYMVMPIILLVSSVLAWREELGS